MVTGQHIVALAERYSSLVSIGLKIASAPALADGKVLPHLRPRFAASITMTLAERLGEVCQAPLHRRSHDQHRRVVRRGGRGGGARGGGPGGPPRPGVPTNGGGTT